MARTRPRLPEAARVIESPSAEALRELAARMPTARETRYGNLNVRTRVLARSTASTYVVSDVPLDVPRVLGRREAERWAERQDAHVARHEMVLLEGFLGTAPAVRTGVRLLVEAGHANVAAMQEQLWFPVEDPASFEPELTVVITPTLAAPGFPDDRLVTVDLDAGVNRVFGSDYFGESKKGALRLWNRLVYERGGLPLHAGCKVVPTAAGERVGLIVGLSGTGKTTTTFTRQNGSLPVQDDFVAWMPDGSVHVTENGCFAKTFGLNPRDEPTIHGAVTQPRSYLENVSQRGDEVDFYDTSFTRNGRATFGFAAIESAVTRPIPRADFLLVLNRDESVIPAVARLEGAQASAFFMLGETRGTSAGGAAEEGRALRVPGTNPFFPLPHALQGNRFLELLSRHPLEVYLMNTGRVGGGEADPRSRKVEIRHSSAIVKAIAEGTIEWEPDPDFGYDVAAQVPGLEPAERAVLQPRLLYAQTGRHAEYEREVARLRAERSAFLEGFPTLDGSLLAAVR